MTDRVDRNHIVTRQPIGREVITEFKAGIVLWCERIEELDRFVDEDGSIQGAYLRAYVLHSESMPVDYLYLSILTMLHSKELQEWTGKLPTGRIYDVPAYDFKGLCIMLEIMEVN